MQHSTSARPAPQQRAGDLLIDFEGIDRVACPCGFTRRALVDRPACPLSIHRTDIAIDAATHYHKRQTEVYYILECGPDARMELNGELHPIRAGMAVHIPPLTRHRAVGQMKVLVIASPRFDAADEWFD